MISKCDKNSFVQSVIKTEQKFSVMIRKLDKTYMKVSILFIFSFLFFEGLYLKITIFFLYFIFSTACCFHCGISLSRGGMRVLFNTVLPRVKNII